VDWNALAAEFETIGVTKEEVEEVVLQLEQVARG